MDTSSHETFAFLSGLCVVLGFIPYFASILRRKSVPIKTSWLIWGILDTIILVGMMMKGTANSLIVTSFFGTWLAFALACKYGRSGWRTIDKVCLAGALLSMVLWGLFNSPLLGILCSLAGLVLGAIPTFQSAWRNPASEDRLGWTFFFFSCVFGVLAIPHWTLGYAAQPLTFSFNETVMMGLLYIRVRPGRKQV